ncbi:MAG: glycosyltransferase, partial [Gemmatimonadota bacterium]|nr:glycosyltransferase [Gemmatimonadota bacterium]
MTGVAGPEDPDVSAIIPTLDEETEIGGTLRRARQSLGPAAELIVVDGGSRDRTRQEAETQARVITTFPG